MSFVTIPFRLAERWLRSLSGAGIILGVILFAAALTPTLVPRSVFVQGALAGGCFAIGYGIGVFCGSLWQYLELPSPPARLRLISNRIIAGAGLSIAIVFLAKSAAWQNSVRSAMSMDPVEPAHPIKVCLLALLVFSALLLLARLFSSVARYLTARIRAFIPRRVSDVIAFALAGLLFWSIGNNLLVQTTLRALDSSYQRFDALLEPNRLQPADSTKTGSAASLVRWNELGRAGREFIATGPSAEEINAFTGRPALQPIRVYVGRRSADTAEARAVLALEELKRQGGFDRSVLVIITPTGTGWVDPSAMGPVEYLHDGDIASVAVQYSYLSSPLSLLVQPEYGDETARALFTTIYTFWTGLPKDKRPKLYLHGLSLGALNSERSIQLFETIGDPIAGALWSGPPFASRIWRQITAGRNSDSPAWLPVFRDSRFARFMNQGGSTVSKNSPWGPLRVVYLQYASDAIVFFSFRDAFRRPAWFDVPRGPDVSPALRWYPIVTMLQLAMDMTVATGTPMGFGHVYAPEHYVDAWVAVTDVRHWSPDALDSLKLHLAQEARRAANGDTFKEGPYDNRGG